MPLSDMSAADAAATRKANPFSGWGTRSSGNRLEPVAKPGFDVPFRLEPGEAIFTVGSCFARNVEAELMRRGFRVPMRELFQQPEFVTLDPGLVNNFGTPSIYNEFAWALGAKPFVPEENILQVQPGRFADLHLIQSIRPGGWEEALRRRQAITAAYRKVAECRVMIVTLGLVEVWFDTKTGSYLNVAPLPGLVRAEPERFRLHVLSFEEVYRYLEDALLLVRERGNPEIRVMLTVSPVPMAATHRPQDVMVANAYSKSVLRAAAETICARHDFVTYYPSFESVTLSDRKTAWEDDLVHVRPELVAVNVGRMLRAFVGETDDEAALREQVATGDLSVVIERAIARRVEGGERAEAFFAEYGALSARSAAFALEHAGFLASTGQEEEALALLEAAPEDEAQQQRLGLQRANLLIALGRPAEAVTMLEGVGDPRKRTSSIWSTMLQAACATGKEETAVGILYRWTQAQPSRTGTAYATIGRWHLDRGNLPAARQYLEQAVASDPASSRMRIYLSQVLIALGCRDEARAAIAGIAAENEVDVKLLDRVAKALA
ncbi:GSCFA domain-containing protein [Belnapia sp. T6]|uniref:GSCFA domain-containing protein n=1 Tax=Belnapia mucosa TaxID=2804532 RepID=A0ABS1V1B6_9PROT|nr:GSCFA domain-containing protein [Belnapia mucosa]MBL6455488.1 GSCFA domain-containing protein [Belnapia mucosa]